VQDNGHRADLRPLPHAYPAQDLSIGSQNYVVVQNGSSAIFSNSNGHTMGEGAVTADLGGSVNDNRAKMVDAQAGANLYASRNRYSGGNQDDKVREAVCRCKQQLYGAMRTVQPASESVDGYSPHRWLSQRVSATVSTEISAECGAHGGINVSGPQV
jgi:hypothetical protein